MFQSSEIIDIVQNSELPKQVSVLKQKEKQLLQYDQTINKELQLLLLLHDIIDTEIHAKLDEIIEAAESRKRELLSENNTTSLQYRVECANEHDLTYRECYIGTEPHCTIKNLSGGTTYFFRVQAINKFGSSAFSEVYAKTCSSRTFTYQNDFDKNGLLYMIGTDNYKREFKNPAVEGKIIVTRSSNWSGEACSAAGRIVTYSHTANHPNSWYCFNLKQYKIIPNYYTLRHDYSPSHALRNWQLQASVDGKEWTVLREHVNDTALSDTLEKPLPGKSHSWPIDNVNNAYSYFRVLQNAKNSSGSDNLLLSGFEIYGTLV